MRRSKTWAGLTVAVVSLGLVGSTAQADLVSNAGFYANQTPYGDPATTSVLKPPAGYELFFVETVARHGARSMTDTVAEKRVLKVWNGASRRGALTTRGKKFDNDLRAFQKAERKIGYGRLSKVGKTEWKGIGRRTAQNYRDFLTGSAAGGDTIAMMTSPVHRTKQSASAMRSGLTTAAPGLKFAPNKVDRDFLIEEGSSKRGKAAIETVKRRSSVKAAARSILLRLYRPSYVKTLDHQVDKALDIYRLYSTAPGMRGDTSVTFADYMPVRYARVMAEVMDARNFYRFGPGVTGENKSYRQAKPILDSFFAQLDKRIAGGKTAAVFRHAHGEVTMPFAALIKAPGSTRRASKSAPYSYGRNPWRGYVAGRLAGSVEWAAYRNADGEVLVTMRYNEQPAKLSSACKPSATGTHFYRVSQLKRCLR